MLLHGINNMIDDNYANRVHCMEVTFHLNALLRLEKAKQELPKSINKTQTNHTKLAIVIERAQKGIKPEKFIYLLDKVGKQSVLNGKIG